MEWISHNISFNFVVYWEHVPPIQIVYLLSIVWIHVNLINKTVYILTYDEERGKKHQNLACLTIESFVSCVNYKEYHVSKIVQAVKILYSSEEEIDESNNMNVFAAEEDPNPIQLLCVNLCSKESDEAILYICVINSFDVATYHHVEE